MRLLVSGLVFVLLAAPGLADAPDTSLRPPPAPFNIGIASKAGPGASASAATRPSARPGKSEALPSAQPEPGRSLQPRSQEARTLAAASPLAIPEALRPAPRPGAIVRKAMAQRQDEARGAVCGDRGLQGERIGPVPNAVNGCGITDAVRLRSVNGIVLSQPATIDCTTAKTLQRWVGKTVTPGVGRRGGGVARLEVAAHYACRGRNNQPGARISEHGKGRAIDISGLRLRDGSRITVLEGWGTRRDGALLARMRRDACGPFGTVLGPGSDGFHMDHFHLDTARHRSGGAYCR